MPQSAAKPNRKRSTERCVRFLLKHREGGQMERKISFQQAVNEALSQEMERDPRIVLMGEDVAGGSGGDGKMDAWGGVLGVTKGLWEKFGDRVIDTPYQRIRLYRGSDWRLSLGASSGGGVNVRRFHGCVFRPDL